MSERKSPSLESLWIQACREYNAQRDAYEKGFEKSHHHFWNHKHKQRNERPEFRSAEDFAKEIERRRREFSDMRMRHHKVFDVMLGMATPVEVIGGQASAIGNMFSPASSMVFGAVMYLFNAGRDVSKGFDALEELFRKCSQHMIKIQMMLQSPRLHTELQQIVLHTLVHILEICRISTEQSKRLKAFVDALARPGQGGPAQVALANLEELGRERDSTVGIDTNVTVTRTSITVEQIKKTGDYTAIGVDRAVTGVEEIKRMMEDQKRGEKKTAAPTTTDDVKQDTAKRARKILNEILNPVSSISDRYKDLTKTTVPGTCEWIFERPEFRNWVEKAEIPVLWIYGQSGAGKSHLAANIVKHFGPSQLLGSKPASKVVVAAYFCEYNDAEAIEDLEATKEIPPEQKLPQEDNAAEEDYDEDRESVGRILGTLAYQLLDDKKYEKELIDHLESVQAKVRPNSTAVDVWKCLFQNDYFATLQEHSVTVVIDGVDNLAKKDRSILYGLLKGIIEDSTKGSKVKFIILSQYKSYEEITKVLPDSHIERIAISEENNRKDIEKMIGWSVDHSPKLGRALRDQSFRAEIIQRLSQTSQGLFEMAALLLKQLSQNDHVDLFSEALENAPKDIQSILSRTLVHFGETHTAQDILDLNSLLAWVLHAKEQPLTLAQLNAATGVESKHGEFLDIQDKLKREFSAYFSVVDLHHKTELGQSTNTSDGNISVNKDEGQEQLNEAGASDTADNLATQKVKVAHASIARFFRSSAIGRIKEKGVPIGVSRAEAHLRLAKTCLSVICSTETSPKTWGVSHKDDLLPYAATNFHKHLAEDDVRSIATLADKVEIFKLLSKVFRDERAVDRWVLQTAVWPTWFDHIGAIGTVWAWLNDQDIQKELKEEDIAWINETSVSLPEKLMKPTALWFAKKWLQDPTIANNDLAIYYFIYLYAFEKLFENPQEEIGTNPEHPFYASKKLDLDHVRKVAEWVGFEKTPLWHTRLAYIIDEIVGHDAAIEDYHVALKMDPDFGQAFYALGMTHGELGDYESAIKEMKEACRLGYPTKRGDPTRGAIFISEWQQARTPSESGTEEALKTLEEGLEKHPDDFPCIGAYLTLAYKGRRYYTVMSTIRKLGTKLPDFLLSEEASGLHDGIKRSAQKTHRVGVVKRAYEVAIEKSKRTDDSQLTAGLLEALFELYLENQEDDRAIDVLNQIIKAIDDDIGDYRVMNAINRKAEIYFNRAWSKTGTEQESTDALNELIKLENEEHPLDPNSTTGYRNGLLLGLLYRLQGQDDKSRPFFRDRIALAMTLLEDDDLSNDYNAWEILQDTLVKAGDLENSAACATLFLIEMRRLIAGNTELADAVNQGADTSNADKQDPQGTPDKSLPALDKGNEAIANGEVPSQGNENGKKPVQQDSRPDGSTGDPELYQDTPWDWGTCDGPCERDMSIYDSGVHACTYCLDYYFCKDCFPLHQSGGLSYKICDADHEFMYTVGAPKNLPKDKVKVGGKIRDRADWLNDIRKKWDLLPKKNDPAVKEQGEVVKAAEDENGK